MAKGALVLVPDAKSSHPVERCLTAKPLILACAGRQVQATIRGTTRLRVESLLRQSRSCAKPRNGATVVVPRMSFWHVRPQSCNLAPPQTRPPFAICPFAHLPTSYAQCISERDTGNCYMRFRISSFYEKRLLSSAKLCKVAPPLCP